MDLKQQVKATRYAQELVTAASQAGHLQPTFDALSQMIAVFQETQLDAVLSSDHFEQAEKKRLVRQLGATNGHEIQDLLEALIQKDELVLLLPTLQSALTKISQVTKVFDIEVTTAQPLTSQQKETLCQLVEKRFGISAHDVIETVDASLIGGFIVTVNHHVIDASIRTQLQELRKKV